MTYIFKSGSLIGRSPVFLRYTHSMKPFVTQIPSSLHDPLKDLLTSRGFTFTQPAYTVFQAKLRTGISCTLYTSGKLVIQGKGAQEFIEFVLEPELLFRIQAPTRTDMNLSLHIGTDESGKGDFFGPLCIAGALPKTEQDLVALYQTEIQDSKKIRNEKILTLGNIIRKHCLCKVIILYPERYNTLYTQFNNLNRLLAWGHATVIHDLAPKPLGSVFAIADQFASSEAVLLTALRKKHTDIQLIQKTHAEQDIVVAAASILAREAFILSIRKLENQYQVSLPMGASASVVTAAKKILRTQGLETLSKLCKTHFKTFQEIQA